ncbi:hypothetical protein [Seonamhaeicola sp.]|uniref:hypothetical protein n=1 Tax=Seonamhaeicola sp. TaxID=1912245 RepID=UPI003563C22B
MTLNQKCEQLKLLAKLLEKEKTGNATQLANKINVSRSKLYEIFEDFKGSGIDIRYSKTRSSFYYNNNLRLKVNIPIEIIPENEVHKVYGGKIISSLSHTLCIISFANR